MDYAEAEWNRQVDDCIRQLQDAQSIADHIASELIRLQSACDSIRSVVSNYRDMDRFDVEVVARLLRDSMGHEIGRVVRTLNAAYDEMESIERVLNTVA